MTKLTAIIIVGCHCYQLHIKCYCLKVSLHIDEIIGEHQCSMGQYFGYLLTSRRKVLYNILIELGLPMNLDRLIKVCLSETYNKVRVGKYLSQSFPIEDGLKQDDVL
jgi:hypothetical protein